MIEKILWIFTIICVLAFSALNLYPYLGFDAASFYYGGLQIADGGKPYLSFIDNKNPLTYYLMAVPALFFSWNVYGVLSLARLVDIVLVISLFYLLKKFTARRSEILAVLICFWVAYLNSFASTYETIYSEMPETLAIIAAYILVYEKKSFGYAGLLLGTGFLFRQSALVHLPCLALFAQMGNSAATCKLRFSLKKSIGLIIGFAAPISLMVCIAFFQGWLEAWWHQAFWWPYKYVASYAPFYERAGQKILQLYSNDFLLFYGIGLILWLSNLFYEFRNKISDNIERHFFVFCVFLAGWCESSLPANFWRHQFIPWLPSLSLMLCLSIALTVERLSFSKKYFLLNGILLSILISTAIPLVSISKQVYQRLFFMQEREVTGILALWLKEHTNPSDKVLVWGYVPQIYIEAERNAASAHYHNLLIDNFGSRFSPTEEDVQILQRDIKADKPQYILLMAKADIRKFIPDIESEYQQHTISTSYGGFYYLKRKGT